MHCALNWTKRHNWSATSGNCVWCGVRKGDIARQCQDKRSTDGGWCLVMGGCPTPKTCHKPHERLGDNKGVIKMSESDNKELINRTFEQWFQGLYVKRGFVSSKDELREAWDAALRSFNSECQNK